MRALVFGARGALGSAICERFTAGGWAIERAGRYAGRQGLIDHDNAPVTSAGPLECVVWAQGANANDAVETLDGARLDELLAANVTLVATSMHALLTAGVIGDGARLVVLSSIWQDVARPGKLSYTVSKAALGGLVRAAAADLAPRGIAINAVLPGVVDTTMTRANLTSRQIAVVANSSGSGRLVLASEVAETAFFLGSAPSGVTGQSLIVDLGFTVVRDLAAE